MPKYYSKETYKHILAMQEEQVRQLRIVWSGILREKDTDKKKHALLAYKNMLHDLKDFQKLAHIPVRERHRTEALELDADAMLERSEFNVHGRKVMVHIKGTDTYFNSIKQTAKYFGVSENKMSEHVAKGIPIDGCILESVKGGY